MFAFSTSTHVNVALLAFNVFYLLNPYVVKPKPIIELVNNKLVKLVILFACYFIAVYYNVAVAIQVVVATLFLEYDFKIAMEQAKNIDKM